MKIAKTFTIAAVAFLFTLFSQDAFAQRLIPGQMTVYAEGSAWMAPGGGIGTSFVKRNFKWDFSAQYRTLNHHVSLPDTKEYAAGEFDLKAQDIYARMMYKRLLAHDRSYSWNFWLGVSFDAGARLRKPAAEYVLDDVERISKTHFIYGFTPELSVEFFPANIFSMSVFARPRMMFVGAKKEAKFGERWFYPEFGMQFNFCFFTKR